MRVSSTPLLLPSESCIVTVPCAAAALPMITCTFQNFYPSLFSKSDCTIHTLPATAGGSIVFFAYACVMCVCIVVALWNYFLPCHFCSALHKPQTNYLLVIGSEVSILPRPSYFAGRTYFRPTTCIGSPRELSRAGGIMRGNELSNSASSHLGILLRWNLSWLAIGTCDSAR